MCGTGLCTFAKRSHLVIEPVFYSKMDIESRIFKYAIEQLSTSIIITDLSGEIIYANSQFEKTSGYSKEEIIGKNVRVLDSGYHPKSHFVELWETLIKTGSWVGEFRNATKQGKPYWGRARISAITNEKGEITHYVSVMRDITVEKIERNEADRRERLLNDIQNLSKTGGWEYDVATSNMYWTDQLYELHAFDRPFTDSHIDQSLQCYHEEDRRMIAESFVKCIQEGIDYDHTLRFKDFKGADKWIRTKSRAVRDQLGNVTKIIGSVRDVTDWVNAEFQLKNSEQRYRDLFQKSPDAAVLFRGLTLIDCNKATLELMGYSDYSEIIGKDVFLFLPETQPDGTPTIDLHKLHSQIVAEKGSHKFELYHKKKGGSLIPLEVTVTRLNDLGGEPFLYVVWRDISVRKKAEAGIRESLKEKEILLSEIHHRVKNNLAVISALMQLQIYSNDDPYAVEILSKSINRIRSIALIHEQLYKSDNFTRISLKENIERQVVTIMDMYSGSLNTDIKVKMHLDEISININQAMPVGLLLNEIINNIYKHAFNGRSYGTMSIILEEVDHEIHLVISDDGVGFDPVADPHIESTLGNTLIRNFLEQLGARYTLTSTNGTSYDIWFHKT